MICDAAIEGVFSILALYFSDPGGKPRQELPPPEVSVEMFYMDRVTSWRLKVSRCLRCQDELKPNENKLKGRYPSDHERLAFWKYYAGDGPLNRRAMVGIFKIHALFEGEGLFDGW